MQSFYESECEIAVVDSTSVTVGFWATLTGADLYDRRPASEVGISTFFDLRPSARPAVVLRTRHQQDI
jgi:hypothetical protein